MKFFEILHLSGKQIFGLGCIVDSMQVKAKSYERGYADFRLDIVGLGTGLETPEERLFIHSVGIVRFFVNQLSSLLMYCIPT